MTKLVCDVKDAAQGRHARLSRVLAACQSFCCLCEEPADQGTRLDRFNSALLQLEDCQGTLSVLWHSETDQAEFAQLVELSWRFQLEHSKIRHAIAMKI